MILIDSSYIHSFGGKHILESVISKLSLLNSQSIFYLFDKRFISDKINYLSEDSYLVIDSNHFNRKKFYKKNKNSFSLIVCLANVPPPIKTNVKTIIYFHNILLVSSFINLKNTLKRLYITYFNLDKYIWIAQTGCVKRTIGDKLNINLNQIKIFPIFSTLSKQNGLTKNKKEFAFFFPSSFEKHKNHNRLILAFIKAASRVKNEMVLHLTILNKNFLKIETPSNLKILFHGTLSEESVSKLYNTSKYTIFPSTAESFGLPLIESANHGCKVISSDLPYVHEIIKPSLTFDPYSVESISKAILKALSEDLPKTKVLVENKLNNFIDFIISQDVQQ